MVEPSQGPSSLPAQQPAAATPATPEPAAKSQNIRQKVLYWTVYTMALRIMRQMRQAEQKRKSDQT